MNAERPDVSITAIGLASALAIIVTSTVFDLVTSIVSYVSDNIYLQYAAAAIVVSITFLLFGEKRFASFMRRYLDRERGKKPILSRGYYDIIFLSSAVIFVVSGAALRLHNAPDLIGRIFVLLMLVSIAPSVLGLIWLFIRDTPDLQLGRGYNWWHFAIPATFIVSAMLIAHWPHR